MTSQSKSQQKASKPHTAIAQSLRFRSSSILPDDVLMLAAHLKMTGRSFNDDQVKAMSDFLAQSESNDFFSHANSVVELLNAVENPGKAKPQPEFVSQETDEVFTQDVEIGDDDSQVSQMLALTSGLGTDRTGFMEGAIEEMQIESDRQQGRNFVLLTQRLTEAGHILPVMLSDIGKVMKDGFCIHNQHPVKLTQEAIQYLSFITENPTLFNLALAIVNQKRRSMVKPSYSVGKGRPYRVKSLFGSQPQKQLVSN